MRSRRKVVIAAASYGAGHREIAEGIADALRSRQEPVAFVITDLLERAALRTSRLAKVAYRAGEDFFPDATGDLAVLARLVPDDPLVPDLSAGGVEAARAALATLAPDAVIATHPVAAAIASEAGGDKAVVACVVPGLGEEGRLWVHPRCDLWFAPTVEVRDELVRRGVDFAKAVVSGVPVREGGRGSRGSLGLKERFTAAVPYAGRADARAIVAALAARGVQVVTTLDEKDAASKGAASVRHAPPETSLQELAQVADVLVTGPCGAAQWVAPSLGKPLIVVAPIPAMEAGSVRVLAYSGAALIASGPEEAAGQAAYLMRHPERASSMSADAAVLGRPNAARVVVERLLAETA